MNVLVCEDDNVLLRIIEFTLKRSSEIAYEIARDGKEARVKLKTKKFDLVLTDINMPYYSGLEVIRYVRKELQLKTPIIVLSNDTTEKTMDDAKKLGVTEYFFKPINPLELLEYISLIDPV